MKSSLLGIMDAVGAQRKIHGWEVEIVSDKIRTKYPQSPEWTIIESIIKTVYNLPESNGWSRIR